jgi:hypothetical protein
MKNLSKISILVITFILSYTSFGQTRAIDSLVQKINNKDAYLLLVKTISPRIKGDENKKIIKIGKEITPDLIKILDNQNKGIAAHFILSEIWNEIWDEEVCCNISYNGDTEIVTINGLKIYIENNILFSTDEDLKKNKKNWEHIWHS